MNKTKIVVLRGLLVLVILSGGLFLIEFIGKKGFDLGDFIVYEHSNTWGYSLRPNGSYKRFGGDMVTINDVGLRSTQDWNKDSSNKILFWGDSVTYGGSYIDDNSTFVAHACKDIEGWSGYNGGVNAYGVLNMILRSRYDMRPQGAKMTVFTFITGDFDRGIQSSKISDYRMRKPPQWFPAIWEALTYIGQRYSLVKLLFESNDGYQSFNKEKDRYNAIDFGLMNLEIEVKRLESEGQIVLIVHSPNVENSADGVKRVRNSNFNLYCQKKASKKFGDRFISLFATIESAIVNQPNLFNDNCHYYEPGHLLVGQKLKEEIKKRINP